MNRLFWLATPALAGAVIMSLELTAFRLYAPYFGYSIYVWGTMISVVMGALAIGYLAGGCVADRSQTDLPLYAAILASAVYQIIVLSVVRSLLSALARDGDFTGTFLATLIIFVPPMIALAAASPFVIRLLARAGHVGSDSGSIYALATVGSIVGILVTSFLLLPRFGTQKTLEVAYALCGALGLVGILKRVHLIALGCLLIFGSVSLVPKDSWPSSTIWVKESAYNLVRVVRGGNRILLLTLNDEASVHTIRDEVRFWTGHYYDYFIIGPLLVPARKLLVLGMGGGGSIASTRLVAPDIEVDAVEIDEKVVEAAVQFFGVRPADVHIHIADARRWLVRDDKTYDLVHVDLYQGGPYIPFYLITAEFFQSVRGHMSENGLLMMNVFDLSRSHELLFSTVATLKRVFPTVVVLRLSSGNTLVLALAQERSIASIRAALDQATASGSMKEITLAASQTISALEVPPLTKVFTDDQCPVEEITRRTMTRLSGARSFGER